MIEATEINEDFLKACFTLTPHETHDLEELLKTDGKINWVSFEKNKPSILYPYLLTVKYIDKTDNKTANVCGFDVFYDINTKAGYCDIVFEANNKYSYARVKVDLQQIKDEHDKLI